MSIFSMSSTELQNTPGIPNADNMGVISLEPTFIGVNPAEIYSADPLAAYILGDNVTQNNFISFIISPGTSSDLRRVSNMTLITMYSADDSFALTMGSSYTSPLTGTGGGGPIASVGASFAQLGGAANSTLQALTGISAFNKAAYLPVWSKTEPISLQLSGLFIATSDPYKQVEEPIEILNMYTCPMTTSDSATVLAPGPVMDTEALAKLSDSMSSSQSSDNSWSMDRFSATAKTVLNTDLSSLFTASDQIFVQLGNTAFLGPVVINSVTQKNPNNSIYTKTPKLLNDLTYGSVFLQYSEVVINVTCYFPPVFNGGKDYDCLQLFPKPEKSAGIAATASAVQNISQSAGFFNPPAMPTPAPVFPPIQTPDFQPKWGGV